MRLERRHLPCHVCRRGVPACLPARLALPAAHCKSPCAPSPATRRSALATTHGPALYCRCRLTRFFAWIGLAWLRTVPRLHTPSPPRFIPAPTPEPQRATGQRHRTACPNSRRMAPARCVQCRNSCPCGLHEQQHHKPQRASERCHPHHQLPLSVVSGARELSSTPLSE